MKLNTYKTSTTAKARVGFTLIELLIVIGIIALLVVISVPAFNALTGARSLEAAQNVISGMLARVRSDAISRGQTLGLVVYQDRATGRATAAEVFIGTAPAWSTGTAYVGSIYTTGVGTGDGGGDIVVYNGTAYACVKSHTADSSTLLPTNTDYWISLKNTAAVTASGASSTTIQATAYTVDAVTPIDILPDAPVQPLPAGVGVQGICNASFDSSTPPKRSFDGYVSTPIILFDSTGRLVSTDYFIHPNGRLGASLPRFDVTGAKPNGLILANPTTIITPLPPVRPTLTTQFGLAIFDRTLFASSGFDDNDTLASTNATWSGGVATYLWTYTQGKGAGGTKPSEQSEENWLDQNSLPVLINRYNGTLIAGQR